MLKTDYAFKKVFGSAESKPILSRFLNALIGFPKGREVADLIIVDPHRTGLPSEVVARLRTEAK